MHIAPRSVVKMACENTVKIFRKLVLDLSLLFALGLCIYLLGSIGHQFKRGFFCGDESLMYPYKDDTVSTPMLRIFTIVIPISVILICEFVLFRNDDERHKVFFFSIPSWLKAVYYPLASFGFGVCYIEIMTYISKLVIGRPRPHFLDVCKPSIDCSLPEWQHRYIEHHEFTCTGGRVDKFPDMYMSFVSGHSTWSAFSLIYLALYLEKRVVWSGTRALRHTLQFAVVMVSWFTSLSRITDFKHHWSDVFVGYVLGMIFAVIVWQWGTDVLELKPKNQPVQQKELTSVHTIQMAQPA